MNLPEGLTTYFSEDDVISRFVSIRKKSRLWNDLNVIVYSPKWIWTTRFNSSFSSNNSRIKTLLNLCRNNFEFSGYLEWIIRIFEISGNYQLISILTILSSSGLKTLVLKNYLQGFLIFMKRHQLMTLFGWNDGIDGKNASDTALKLLLTNRSGTEQSFIINTDQCHLLFQFRYITNQEGLNFI